MSNIAATQLNRSSHLSRIRFLLPMLAAVASLLWGGCASAPLRSSSTGTASTVPMTTGRVLSSTEVRQQVRGSIAFLGDETYAEVNSEWLAAYQDHFSAELFRMGIPHWEDRFDCNRFAAHYTSLAQAEYFRTSFHSRTQAKALALAPYWYVRTDGQSHAVIQALTERGRIFIDPQTGKELQLKPAELRSVFPQFL